MAPWLSTKNFPWSKETWENIAKNEKWTELTRKSEFPKWVSKKVARLLTLSESNHVITYPSIWEISLDRVYEEDELIFWLSEHEATHFLLNKKNGFPIEKDGLLLWADFNLLHSNIIELSDWRKIVFIARGVGIGRSYFDFRKYILIDTESYDEIGENEFIPEEDSQIYNSEVYKKINLQNSLKEQKKEELMEDISLKEKELLWLKRNHNLHLKTLTPRELAQEEALRSYWSILDLDIEDYAQSDFENLESIGNTDIKFFKLPSWEIIIVEILDGEEDTEIKIHLIG
jgi:hypothetical protein